MKAPPLHHRRIAISLLGMLIALTLLTCVAMALLLQRQRAMALQVEDMATRDFERVLLVSEVNENANDAARKMMVVLTAERALRVSAYQEIDAANRQIDSAVALLQRSLDNAAQVANLTKLKEALLRFRRAFIDMADLVEGGDIKAAQRQFLEATDFELSALIGALQNIDRTQQEELQAHVMHVQSQLRRDSHLLMGMGAGLAVIGLAMALWLRQRVLQPLGEAARTAHALAQGDLGQRLVVRRADEVGQMAVALNLLADGMAQREQALRQLIDIDPLTRLSQRTRFLQDSAPVLEAAAAKGQAMAIVCFDIGRLKSINALLGFDAGDTVIVQAAERAKKLAVHPLQATRLAGGTFALWMPISPGSTPATQAMALHRELEHRVDWQGHPMDLSVTLGLALFPEHGQAADNLMRRAEHALYEGKRLRAAVTTYVPGTDAARMSHLSLLSDLQTAIAEGQLQPFLQPKLCLRTHTVVGAEALVRWRHPQRGWVSPAEFIPFAESTGRITQVTHTMLTQCVALAGQLAQRNQPFYVAVNLSTYDLRDAGLPQRLADLLTCAEVPAANLQLEITESGLLDSGEGPVERLRALRALGIGLAIDDFGTGQSSLAYLQQLPAQEMKIDRSFVQAVDENATRRGLLEAIVRLGHSLGLTVTAEGVETAGELAVLRAVGCDLAQGYLLAKPMAVPDFLAWLDTHQPSHQPPQPSANATLAA